MSKIKAKYKSFKNYPNYSSVGKSPLGSVPDTTNSIIMPPQKELDQFGIATIYTCHGTDINDVSITNIINIILSNIILSNMNIECLII